MLRQLVGVQFCDIILTLYWLGYYPIIGWLGALAPSHIVLAAAYNDIARIWEGASALFPPGLRSNSPATLGF